jgi:hypothetical protein
MTDQSYTGLIPQCYGTASVVISDSMKNTMNNSLAM